jgi:hypothetical protein
LPRWFRRELARLRRYSKDRRPRPAKDENTPDNLFKKGI